MQNRVTVTIDGIAYTVVAEETEEYIRKNAALVDRSMAEVKSGVPSISALSAAVLAALNIADKYYKSLESAENLRTQIRQYAAENSELRAELNKLRKASK